MMPIFTFMGSNILRRDDPYSLQVITETIDTVVPPLIIVRREGEREEEKVYCVALCIVYILSTIPTIQYTLTHN